MLRTRLTFATILLRAAVEGRVGGESADATKGILSTMTLIPLPLVIPMELRTTLAVRKGGPATLILTQGLGVEALLRSTWATSIQGGEL